MHVCLSLSLHEFSSVDPTTGSKALSFYAILVSLKAKNRNAGNTQKAGVNLNQKVTARNDCTIWDLKLPRSILLQEDFLITQAEDSAMFIEEQIATMSPVHAEDGWQQRAIPSVEFRRHLFAQFLLHSTAL